MNKSRYLEKLTKECNKIRKIAAKKTLIFTISLTAISVAAYVGFPLLDSRAKPTAIMFSSLCGLISFIFLIKFLLLSRKISDKVLIKCEQQIEKNLGPKETFETFDNDITNPAFGEHIVNGSKVYIGHTFVLFQCLTVKGPSFQILRGDSLGEFCVYYFSKNGIVTDICVDINDKNDKFIRSITLSNKDQFYKLLNALKNIKSYANGEYIPTEQSLGYEDNEFVGKIKNKVSRQNRRGLNILGILGIAFSIFLIVASVNSGEAFAYAGIILSIVSIIFIIGVNMKFKQHDTL